MSILIRDVLLKGSTVDIYVEDNEITEIGDVNVEAEHTISGRNKEVLPAFYNGHNHAAMTLLRGYADDMLLHEWLSEKIWPLEAKMTESDVYVGAKLACLEMIKTGTVFFNDMYWHLPGTYKAADESGLRAAVSGVHVDQFKDDMREDGIKTMKRNFSLFHKKNDRIQFALGPHAIYTVSKESLEWIRDFSEEHDLFIHFHLSETEKEVKDCVEQHGCRPVEYLEKLGFLSERFIGAHAVWLNDKEINLLAKNKARVVHNPISNMKLSVGKAFQYNKLRDAGVLIGLGTDGCASNNNLDMLEEMKFATVLQKFTNNDPTALNAKETFDLATRNGAKMFGINAGRIREGMEADMILVDIMRPEMTPNYNIVSNIIYSAGSACVDTTICDGKILMRNRKVDGERELLREATEVANDLISRSM
ncbi:amidohydrolase [Candidatus Woesearchaeota archaeon]|nr:amidohydrolase [Candidatus Woesearchaeota archaeon]